MPASGMSTGHRSIQKWGGGTQGQIQRRFGPDQSAGSEQRFKIADTNINVDARCDHIGTIGAFDVAMVRVPWHRAEEFSAAAER